MQLAALCILASENVFCMQTVLTGYFILLKSKKQTQRPGYKNLVSKISKTLQNSALALHRASCFLGTNKNAGNARWVLILRINSSLHDKCPSENTTETTTTTTTTTTTNTQKPKIQKKTM